MGGRKKQPQKQYRAMREGQSTFTCPNCGRTAMKITIKRKKNKEGNFVEGEATAKCSYCGLEAKYPAGELTEAVDVYGNLIDDFNKEDTKLAEDKMKEEEKKVKAKEKELKARPKVIADAEERLFILKKDYLQWKKEYKIKSVEQSNKSAGLIKTGGTTFIQDMEKELKAKRLKELYLDKLKNMRTLVIGMIMDVKKIHSRSSKEHGERKKQSGEKMPGQDTTEYRMYKRWTTEQVAKVAKKLGLAESQDKKVMIASIVKKTGDDYRTIADMFK